MQKLNRVDRNVFLIELQEFERRFDPRMPRGADIVDEYVADMLEQCRLYAGKVLVAELDGAVVGYATILTRVPNEELEDGDYEYGLISDLVVLESYRGRGFGRKLLGEAEAYARTAEVQWLRIGVLSDNRPALELYGSLGFSGRYTELEKNLRE